MKQLQEAKHDNLELSNYNIREFAKNSVYNRHHFEIESFNQSVLHGKEEQYHSLYFHSKEIENYLSTHFDEKGKKTLSGYKNAVYANELVIDIDRDDLELALQKTREFIQILEHNYEVDPRYLKVNFSGSKGFHIRIPSILFDDFEPSTQLPNLQKSIVEKLFSDSTDTSIYRHTGLIRVVNSINAKTKLTAIPLHSDEVKRLSIDEIKNLAKDVRVIDYIDDEELVAIDSLVELKTECAKSISPVNHSTSNNKSYLSGKEPGKRHENLTKLVGHLLSMGMKHDEVLDIALMWNEKNDPPKDEDEITKQVNDLVDRYGSNTFYEIVKDKDGEDKVVVDMMKYMDYFEENGMSKVFLGKDYLFVKIDNNLVEEVTLPKIKDYVFDDLKNSNTPTLVMNYLLDRVGKYFGTGLMECVKTKELDLMRDKKDEGYLFYKNGFVIIKKHKKPELVTYDQLEAPIWKNQIKERDIDIIDIKQKQSEFEQFLWNVVGHDWDRFLSLCSSIGYLIHNFKDKATTKAVIFCDENISENPNGRTGKSLVGRALSFVRNTTRIDGRNFVFTDRFTFQDVNVEDEVVEFNDVKKNFQFDNLFSVITDDMWVEYKNQNKYKIPFDVSPKFMISTNYTIQGIGDSYKARMFELEFSDHYNADHTPQDEFGHLFFDEWDEAEWNRFDNFMIECLKLYIDWGLVDSNKMNLTERKLIDATLHEFVDFADVEINLNKEYNKEEIYQRFKTSMGYGSDLFDKFPYKKNTFTKWLHIYAAFRNLNCEERKSNCDQYIRLAQ